ELFLVCQFLLEQPATVTVPLLLRILVHLGKIGGSRLRTRLALSLWLAGLEWIGWAEVYRLEPLGLGLVWVAGEQFGAPPLHAFEDVPQRRRAHRQKAD